MFKTCEKNKKKKLNFSNAGLKNEVMHYVCGTNFAFLCNAAQNDLNVDNATYGADMLSTSSHVCNTAPSSTEIKNAQDGSHHLWKIF